MKPEVTIIVPIYNIEVYIHRCIKSILSQTFKNFECILVNDGSTDNCPQICNEYSLIDIRVKVLHKKHNEGLPQARKTGLDASSGQYVLYVDGDDWIEPDMVELLYITAQNTNCDIVITDFFINTDFEQIKYNSPEIYDKLTIFKHIITSGSFSPNVWNKLVKREIYNKIIFPVHNYIEDKVITIQTIYYANNIEYLKKSLYHYCNNNRSICESYTQIKKDYDEYYNFIIIFNFLKENGLFFFLEKELKNKINLIKLLLLINKDSRYLFEKSLTDLYPESTNHIFSKNNMITLNKKIIIFIGSKNNPFTYFIVDILLLFEAILKYFSKIIIND